MDGFPTTCCVETGEEEWKKLKMLHYRFTRTRKGDTGFVNLIQVSKIIVFLMACRKCAYTMMEI